MQFALSNLVYHLQHQITQFSDSSVSDTVLLQTYSESSIILIVFKILALNTTIKILLAMKYIQVPCLQNPRNTRITKPAHKPPRCTCQRLVPTSVPLAYKSPSSEDRSATGLRKRRQPLLEIGP